MKYFQKYKILKLLVTIFLLPIYFNNIIAQNKPTVIKMGSTESMFSNVNLRDAKAIIEIWGKMITENSPTVSKTLSKTYGDIDALVADVNNAKLDIMFMNSIQYYKIEGSFKATPYYSTIRNKNKFLDIYFLVNKKKGVSSFADLKDSKISVQGGRYRLLSEFCLDLLCLQNGIIDKYKFFKEIEFIENQSKVILNVFFEKSDVCITTDYSFNTVKEMNPQIGRTLNIFYERKNLINDLFCVSDFVDNNLKEAILRFGEQIDTKPNTEQIYNLFKIDGTYRLSESDMTETIKLWDDYNKVQKNK